jgi:RNA polymerase sigma factor (sigma-70 family)
MTSAGEEFDAVFRELVVPAYNLALRILGDRYEAQDAAAEAMARTLSSWRQVSQLPYLRQWVLRVTANVAIDMARRRRAVPDSDRVADALAGVFGGDDDLDARMGLAGVLATLPQRQREVIVLRYLVDLSEEDVAASLGIAEGTVKRHAARAVAKLRRLLGTADDKELYFAY